MINVGAKNSERNILKFDRTVPTWTYLRSEN